VAGSINTLSEEDDTAESALITVLEGGSKQYPYQTNRTRRAWGAWVDATQVHSVKIKWPTEILVWGDIVLLYIVKNALPVYVFLYYYVVTSAWVFWHSKERKRVQSLFVC
jgi:hypothetical protein